MVRGFQPWPNAFTNAPDGRLIIWKAEARPTGNEETAPGGVLVATGDDLIVKCGEQTELRLIEVQPEAKRRLNVRDYLNGAHLSAGARFQ
jgi:methionyl-tRNA formyltransferase